MQTTKGELRLEHGGKRGPGRPKGSGKMRKKRGKPAEIKKPVVLPPAATELKVPPYIAGSIQATQIPSLPGISKRGRGRPKKTPPVLEPIIPHKEVKQKGIFPRLPVGPKGLMRVKQHKHKKRKHRPREFTIDPKFIAEVDKLANEFEKCSISLGFKPKFDGGIPSVFRVKKVLKKKKGNERPKTSDKESGPEVTKEEAVQQREKAVAVAVSPAHSSVITKKRIKKSTVEIPKVIIIYLLKLLKQIMSLFLYCFNIFNLFYRIEKKQKLQTMNKGYLLRRGIITCQVPHLPIMIQLKSLTLQLS